MCFDGVDVTCRLRFPCMRRHFARHGNKHGDRPVRNSAMRDLRITPED